MCYSWRFIYFSCMCVIVSKLHCIFAKENGMTKLASHYHICSLADKIGRYMWQNSVSILSLGLISHLHSIIVPKLLFLIKTKYSWNRPLKEKYLGDARYYEIKKKNSLQGRKVNPSSKWIPPDQSLLNMKILRSTFTDDEFSWSLLRTSGSIIIRLEAYR